MAVVRRRAGRLHPRAAASAEDGGSRACCLARNAAQPQGKKVGGAVAGQVRTGARPAPREAASGASPALSAENDAGGRRLFSTFGAAGASALRHYGHHAPTQRQTPRPTGLHGHVGFGSSGQNAYRMEWDRNLRFARRAGAPGVNKQLEGKRGDKTKAQTSPKRRCPDQLAATACR